MGDKAQNGKGWRDDGTAYTLDVGSEPAVAYQCQGSNVGPMGTLRKGNGDVTGGRPFVGTWPLDLRNAMRSPKRDAVNRQGIGVGGNGDPAMTLTRGAVPGVAHAFDARQQDVAHTLRGTGHDASEDGTGERVGALALDTYNHAAAEVSHTLRVGFGSMDDSVPATLGCYGVRRLSCIEMERLQGFPDGWTLIPYGPARKRIEADEAAYLRRHWPHLGDDEIRRLAKDGPRAKALGNSMAVPCMAWIGERIALLDRERP